MSLYSSHGLLIVQRTDLFNLIELCSNIRRLKQKLIIDTTYAKNLFVYNFAINAINSPVKITWKNDINRLILLLL